MSQASIAIKRQRFTLFFIVIALGLIPILFMIVDRQMLEPDVKREWQERDDLTSHDRARVKQVTEPTQDFSKPEPFETMQGGAGTSLHRFNRDAFSQSAKNISFDKQMDFELGDALFRKIWVSSPSSTLASDGLGPLYNARACQSCHVRDGRGRPPEPGESAISMFLRLGQTASTPQQRQELAAGRRLVFPDPLYGTQLQNFAVPGLKAEGHMGIHYSYTVVTLDDGTDIELRVPEYSVDNLALGPLDDKTTVSPRVAPPMIGLGLIEQIHEADILALADPDDRDGDGISGKPQILGAPVGATPHQARLGGGSAGGSAGISTPRVSTGGGSAGGVSTPRVSAGAFWLEGDPCFYS